MAEFSLPQLLATVSSGTQYNVALATAVNRALRTRNEREYQVAIQEATQIAVGYENVNVATRKNYGTSSVLAGQPLFMPLELKGTDGLDDLLLESAVLEVSQQKNIVKTAIQGRDASVLEFINNGDFVISVGGLLCTNDANYPMDQVLQLVNFMKLKKPIEVKHELLNALGIYEIVVFDYKIPKTPHFNCQAFSFNCEASEPLPLIVELRPGEKLV